MSTTTAMDLLTTNVVQQQINDNFVGKHMFLERVNLGRGFEGVLQKHQIKKRPEKASPCTCACVEQRNDTIVLQLFLIQLLCLP